MRRWLNRAAAQIRARAPLLLPLALALALAALVVTPTQAIWFQVLVANESVSTGGFPTAVLGTQVAPNTTGTPRSTRTPDATGTPRIARTPGATPSPCAGASLEGLLFDGHLSLSGDGPFVGGIDVTNERGESARDVMIGFATIEGSEHLSRVDFSNGQDWLIDGQPAVTLYGIGDLAAGETAHLELHIQMTDPWIDTPAGTQAIIGARVADLACPAAAGDATLITLSREPLELTQTPPAEASPPAPSETQTPAITGTPAPIQTTEAATATPEITGTPAPVETTETRTATPEITLTPPLTRTPARHATRTPDPDATSASTYTPPATKTAIPSHSPEPHTPAPAPSGSPEATLTPASTETPTATPNSAPRPARSTLGVTSVATATHTAVPARTSASSRTAREEPPLAESVSEVLGQTRAARRSGEVLPDTGSGALDGSMNPAAGGLLLLAVSIGLVGTAVWVGRRTA